MQVPVLTECNDHTKDTCLWQTNSSLCTAILSYRTTKMTLPQGLSNITQEVRLDAISDFTEPPELIFVIHSG